MHTGVPALGRGADDEHHQPLFYGLMLAAKKKQKKKAVAAEAPTAFNWIARVNRLRTG